jgi:hypothetical protein
MWIVMAPKPRMTMTEQPKSASTQETDPFEVELCDPKKLTTSDWAQIEAILRTGGAVNVVSAMSAIPHAPAFALARRGGKIVGVGAIKRPRPDYAKQKQKDANVTFDTEIAELGYVAIDAKFRDNRLSGRITDKLLAAYPGPLFSTTDDEKMKFTLGNRGFLQKGDTWKGDRGVLSLWLRNGERN